MFKLIEGWQQNVRFHVNPSSGVHKYYDQLLDREIYINHTDLLIKCQSSIGFEGSIFLKNRYFFIQECFKNRYVVLK